MPPSDNEIVVGEPGEPEDRSPALTASRTVELAVYVILLGLALLLGWDNVRSGIGWAHDGPQSGYLPFYLCVILGGSALWGIGTLFIKAGASRAFVTRNQFRRVLQVLLPTLLFVAAMQWLGLYTASFLLIAGFMRFIGRIAWWKSIVTALVFVAVMFATFDVAFDVIMPKGPLENWLGR